MFTVYGHDNDIHFFEGRKDVRRCGSCGLLLAKWKEDLSAVAMPAILRLDLSTSRDGIVVVSKRFRSLYDSTGMSGLLFTAVGRGGFVVQATRIVEFDAERRGTRFIHQCDVCGQFESVVGAAPVFLIGGVAVPEMEFARTDLEFGSMDEKTPMLVCGDEVARILRQANLKGIDLESVRPGPADLDRTT